MEIKSVINKIFSGKADSEAHEDFVKFGKGIFKDRYMIDVTKRKDSFSFKTSYEYGNYFVRMCANEAISENTPVHVKGVVVSTRNLKTELPFPISSMKQFAGVKQAIIDSEIKPSEIIAALDKFPKAFFGLSFSTTHSQLKVKAKAPKSGKPSPKGEKKAIPDFCSLKTKNHLIVHDLLFDVKDKQFDNASIFHTIEVKKINVPKGVSDPVEMREKATREGIISRKIIINNSESEVFEENKTFNV